MTGDRLRPEILARGILRSYSSLHARSEVYAIDVTYDHVLHLATLVIAPLTHLS